MNQNGSILNVQNISKVFHTRNGSVEALRDVTFTAQEGEFVCILGPSGCGKTTLLKIIAGLRKPTSGEIHFGDTADIHRFCTSLVFQEQGMFPWMTVIDNVAFGLEMQGVARHERYQKAQFYIDRFGLNEFSMSYPQVLSGGMRQRVAIARAFLANPEILLMDEPFGSLDAQTRLVLQEDLLQIWRENQKMIIYVTHDIEEAILMGDRILVMSGHPGRIREELVIPYPRPRKLLAEGHKGVADFKWRIWKMLEGEVRSGLETYS